MLKRLVDLAVAGAGLVLLSPLLFMILIAIYAAMGLPVFFRQERPGQGGRPFTLIKFRTMRLAPAAAGAGLSDEERLTSLGRFLRATSLDELPELWNVVRGEMSLVGPRPLLMRYLDRYTPEQARRHEVRPGLTGWAQIHGRNAMSWERKLALDVWYVDHASFRLDARILMRTLLLVLTGRGVSHPGHATSPEFLGTAGGPRRTGAD